MQEMEVKDILRAAHEAVEAAAVPDELRSEAFSKAVDLLSIELRGRSNPASEVAATRTGSRNVAQPTSLLERIASKLDIDVETVGEVYREVDGDVRLIAPASKLTRGKSAATKQVALLVAAARQAAGIEEFTSADVIRAVADDYRTLDSPNFAATLREMSTTFRFDGTSRNRMLKVSRPGWEEARRLVQELGGDEK